jgi:hypothetical protein
MTIKYFLDSLFIFLFPKVTRGIEPISYRGVLALFYMPFYTLFTQFAEYTSTDCK